jgi:hypothetical protein
MTTMPSIRMTAAVQGAYTKYVSDHHGDLSDVEGFASTMFNAGGSHAIKAMVEFGDVIPQLHRIEARVQRLLVLLEAFSEEEP